MLHANFSFSHFLNFSFLLKMSDQIKVSEVTAMLRQQLANIEDDTESLGN